MALFRRKKAHGAAQPAEEAAEIRETSTPVYGFGALSSVAPIDEEIAAEELRSAANPEDDGARTQMIDNERRREEHDR
jgi:hypothetical protein